MSIIRPIVICVVILLYTIPITAQFQEAGTSDYALANSSVLWLPRSSALFLNPGELARLHQNEFLVSSARFRSLASMSADVFVPSVGTFGVGTASEGNSTLYSTGFGYLVKNHSTVGGALSMLSNVEGGFRFSLGGAFHLPLGVEESGLHAGLSVTNLPTRGILNAGAGYWLLPTILRLQLATQTRLERAAFVGAEAKVLENVHIQAGTRGFKALSAGMSYSTQYAVLELGVGQQGISFTMNVRFGDAASDNYEKAFDEANEAFVDQRFSEAQTLFAKAIQYDEYDRDSRTMIERSKQVLDSSVTVLLQEAQAAEKENDFPAAMKAYAEILKMNPSESGIVSRSENVGQKLHAYIGQLLGKGDSLLARREVTRARRLYEQVLEFDPENDSASARIDQLENLSKENVRVMLGRARSLQNRSQLDEAQHEYERILEVEPKNSQARAGLNAIRNRHISEQVEQAKNAYNEKKYFDALTMFADILQRDAGNKEARLYLEKTRDALKADIDRLFKKGLQFYIKEDFKSAISEWDMVLLIQPSDSSTIQYRRRAEEKLKALEQFK